jgi:two-component system alkaline phosphatase synthesis response regulator PhoP
VLAIDDDPTILEVIAHALGTLRGYEVRTAETGAKGLELYHQEPADCVIVDVKMPEMDGFQFLRALRGDPASAQTPVIVLSALTAEPYPETGWLSGADEYMQKPFKPSALCAMVERVLQITPEERAERAKRFAAGAPPGHNAASM